MAIQLAIHGAAGRMGKRLVALASTDPDLRLAAALEHAGAKELGRDSGMVAGVAETGVPISADWPASVQVAIDFSVPAGCESALEHCIATGTPLVIATTGLSPELIARIHLAAKSLPICWAPNMSLAVNLTMRLAERAAAALANAPQGVDVEIIERHHRFKEDSPSGTALKFGELIAKQLEIDQFVHGREGQCGARPRKEIGYHAVRAGDDPGQHTILFGMMGETIELRVAASNRDCYAQGALAAAKFLVGRAPGLYSMFDVLGV